MVLHIRTYEYALRTSGSLLGKFSGRPRGVTFPSGTAPMANKLGWVVTYLKGLLPINLHHSLVMWSCYTTWQIIFSKILKPEISSTRILMATKPDMVITYPEGFPPITSLDPLTSWSCEVTWQIKYFVSPLALDQWRPNTGRWWIAFKGFQPQIHRTF